MKSLDPRIDKLLQDMPPHPSAYLEGQCWEAYEVFQQPNTGESYSHVGSIHAPDPEFALLFAKEQYGRRSHTANMWVVKSSAIVAFSPDETDIFDTTPEKVYREPSEYNKVRDKIIQWQEKKQNK